MRDTVQAESGERCPEERAPAPGPRAVRRRGGHDRANQPDGGAHLPLREVQSGPDPFGRLREPFPEAGPGGARPPGAALLRAALIHARVLDVDIPDTGGLRGDLVALTEQIVALLTGPRTEPVARALLSGTGLPDDELGSLTRDFFADRFSREQPVFARAAARGELPEHIDPMLLLDLLAGAVWVRVLLRRETPPPGFAREIVDAVLPR